MGAGGADSGVSAGGNLTQTQNGTGMGRRPRNAASGTSGGGGDRTNTGTTTTLPDQSHTVHQRDSGTAPTSLTGLHSQSRAGRWRSNGAKYFQQVKGRLRSFRRGSRRYRQKIKPSPEDVLRSTVDPISHPTPRSDEPIFTAAAASALSDEQAAGCSE
jgi:hypothetical protein